MTSKQSRRGTNPNSLANLNRKGTEPLYGEPKQGHELSLTPTSWKGLGAIARASGFGRSISALVEAIGRQELRLAAVGLVPDGKPVAFSRLAIGSLFSCQGMIALKSEYESEGAIVAYIVGAGERFWGGTATAIELNALIVQPLKLLEGGSTNREL